MIQAGRSNQTILSETVTDRLRELVAKAEPGSQLPPVRQLMSTFGVSQHAIQKALDQLRDENLITSHVGKGTFVGNAGALIAQTSTRTKSVLTLTRDRPYERGDAIARQIHQRLLIDGHNSLVVAYNDEQHLMDQFRGGIHFDGCIIQPRASIVSTALLDFARKSASRVIVEAFDSEGIDVDAVSNDPLLTVLTIMEVLKQAGHERILWLTEDRQNYFFRQTTDHFRAYCAGMGLSPEAVPITTFEVDPDSLAGSANLAAALGRHLKQDRTITAVVLGSFIDGASALAAFGELGLSTPRDISLIRMGSPDLESDHARTIDVVGRPSACAARTVVDLLYRLWKEPNLLPTTLNDPPEHVAYGSVSKPSLGI